MPKYCQCRYCLYIPLPKLTVCWPFYVTLLPFACPLPAVYCNARSKSDAPPRPPDLSAPQPFRWEDPKIMNDICALPWIIGQALQVMTNVPVIRYDERKQCNHDPP